MGIANYTDLKAALANWLARSETELPLDDFIALAEERLARDIFTRYTEQSTGALILTGGVATVPSDFIRLKYAHLQTATGSDVRHYLKPKPAEWIIENYPGAPSGSANSGIPEFIGVQNGKFIFGPVAASDNYVLRGFYSFKPAALSSSNETNEWTNNFPDALLWGCLCESAPFLKNDQRALAWEQKYDLSKERINRAEAKITRTGARISPDIRAM